MKSLFRILLAIVAVSSVACRGPVQEATKAAKSLAIFLDPETDKVLVAAHRADWRHFPENSIPAIESAIRMGVDIVELDVAMTSDSVLVLSHDGTVDRCTDGTGPVSSFTLDSIRTLRLKDPQGLVIDTIGMPTLEEALRVCKDRILVNVDHGWSYYPQVLEVASRVGSVEQIIFKTGGTRSACTEPMQQCKASGIQYMPMVGVAPDGTSPNIDSWLDGGELPAVFEISFSKDIPEVDRYTGMLREAGAKLWINSIWGSLCGDNDDDMAFRSPEDAERYYGRLLGLGAKVFQSDRPDYLIDYLRKKGLHD